MRKFLIDTDTGSDDAVALLMAARVPDIELLGVTTLGGNIPLVQTTKNALQALEEADAAHVAVYPGAAQPLVRPLVTADNVHGLDGMGDQGLIHPVRQAENRHAVAFILETVAAYPDEVELIALGPATNIALAILQDRATMRKVKHIWSMGTAGFGVGNMSPVAEFNVYVDAESYAVLLESGIPLTIIGFDQCLGAAALTPSDLDALAQSKLGKFAVRCNTTRYAYNKAQSGVPYVDLPDAVAMAVALWPSEIVTESVEAYCYCCTKEEPSYGQVIVYDLRARWAEKYRARGANATVIKSIDPKRFKTRLQHVLDDR